MSMRLASGSVSSYCEVSECSPEDNSEQSVIEQQGTHLHMPRMLHDVLEIFIAGQPRELMGDCDLPVDLGVPSPGMDQARSSLGRELVYPLVFGLKDLLNWLRVGSHLVGLV